MRANDMVLIGEVGVGDEGGEEGVGVRGEGADEFDVERGLDL